MAWCFVLLALAICCAWLPGVDLGAFRVDAWLLPFALATACAVYFGVVLWTGVLILVALVTAARVARSPGAVGRVGVMVTVVIALALALHLAPGFSNPKLFDSVRLSADAAPLTQYLNFDKGAAGLVLLAAFAPRAGSAREAYAVLRTALPIAVVTVIASVALALALHYIRFDPKLPTGAVAFLGANLFFTCIAEEAFFRGFLQERLARSADRWRLYPWLAVSVSALLFGAAHAAAGSTFLALATLAGFGYAIAYAMTRRIEAPILAHFAVNATQFLGFTYPYLVRG